MEALLCAFLGGWVARYFASGRDPDTVAQPAAETRLPKAGERAAAT
jgi:hypothetical protein